MVQRGYHSRPAKTAAWGEGHIDQPLLVHIQNGVFGLLQVLSFLDKEGIQLVDESGLRRAVAMYVTHDLHKMTEYAISREEKRSQFDQSLEDYLAEINALGLDTFADTVPAMHRAAAVSLCSPKTGDLSACPPGTALLVDLVHLADCMASMTGCQQTATLANRLQKLLPPGKAQKYAFYYHCLDDIKGLFTNLIHRAVSQVLETEYGLYALLYFADSTLYLGPAELRLPERTALLPRVEQEIFQLLLQQPPSDLSDAFDTLNIKVQSYAFLFLDAAGVSALLRQYAANTAQTGFWRKTLEKHIKDYSILQELSQQIKDDVLLQKLAQEELYRKLGMPPGWDEDITRNQAVFSTARYLAAAKRLWERLQPGADGLAELTRLLGLPAEELELVRRCIPDKYSKDKTYDDCIALAWRWLAGFSAAGRSGFSMPVDMLLNYLEKTFLPAWQSMLKASRRQELVEHELALRSGLAAYLAEHLFFSWDNQQPEQTGATVKSRYAEYCRPRSSAQKKFCSLCNGSIPAAMKDSNIKAGIFEGEVQTYSNRVRPTGERGVQALVWCPVCYLEYMLRQFAGVAYAAGAERSKSDRLYLFLLPDYSFTRLGLMHFSRLLQDLGGRTRLRLRGTADKPGLPQLWLESRQGEGSPVSAAWLNKLRRSWQEEAASISEKWQQDGRRPLGDQFSLASFEQTNFFLAVYERSASQSAKDVAIPTRSEIWAKATYAALLAHLLLGVRVLVTEKPYLPVSDPGALRTALLLDGLHPVLRLLWPDQQSGRWGELHLAQLPRVLDVLAALWEVVNVLDSKDKNIARRFQAQLASPLGGAMFYKEEVRQQAFVTPAFVLACRTLLDYYGGAEMDLAREIAELSMEIFLPRRGKQEGRAHRYETVFRTAVESLKKSAGFSPAEMKTLLAGTLQKRLQRLDGGDTGYLACRGEELAEKLSRLADLLVDELFIKRCGGSMARLNSLSNALADGIYFITDTQIAERSEKFWAARRRSGEQPAETE